MFARKALGLYAVLSFALIAGCAENKLTRENYDTIVEGSSTQEEVRWTMGEKHLTKMDDVWLYDLGEKHASIYFTFDQNGTVKRKQWIDGSGEWHDSEPEKREGDRRYDGSRNTTIKK